MEDRFLVAFDESPQALSALHHALGTFPDATIYVIHVNDPREWIYGDTMGGGYYSEDAFENAEESAQELLASAETIAADYDVTITSVTEIGRPAAAIVEYAEENDIDHIILGSHGRRGIARFLLGSVAESVARRSPVSVTIIRDPNATTNE